MRLMVCNEYLAGMDVVSAVCVRAKVCIGKGVSCGETVFWCCNVYWGESLCLVALNVSW